MKCVAIKGVKDFEVKEIKEPTKEVGKSLIHVTKSGICGSDIHYWDIGQPEGLVMGHEFCGIVEDNGGSEDFKVGDRVTALPISPCGKCEACEMGNVQYCKETWSQAVGLSLENPGGLTSKISVRNDMIIKVPDNVSDTEAAMVEPAAVGLHAIHLADIKVGEKVLIIGGGIIGLVSAMFAKKEGASYVALTETNPMRGKKAVDLDVVDEWFLADEECVATLRTKLPEGFDTVIECCGNGAAVTTAMQACKQGGKIVLVGVSLGPITIPTVISVMAEQTILGAIAYTKDEFRTCLELLENKQIDLMKFVSKEIGLDEVQDAYLDLTSGKTESIKVIVDPNK